MGSRCKGRPWGLRILFILGLLALLLPASAMADRPLQPPAEPQAEEESALPDEAADETPARRSLPLDQQPLDPDDMAVADRRVFDPGIEQATPDSLIGRDVVNLEGERLGRVDDIVRDRRTDSLHAVVATGGFFGIGERQALLPLQQMHLTPDDRVRLQSNISVAQFQQMAAFDRHGYEPVARAESIASIAGLDDEA